MLDRNRARGSGSVGLGSQHTKIARRMRLAVCHINLLIRLQLPCAGLVVSISSVGPDGMTGALGHQLMPYLEFNILFCFLFLLRLFEIYLLNLNYFPLPFRRKLLVLFRLFSPLWNAVFKQRFSSLQI